MPDVRLILGKRGTGKSTLLKRKLDLVSRFVVYNTLGESTYPYESIKSIPELCDRLAGAPRRLAVAYRGVELPLEEDFDSFCRAVWATGDLTIGIDEIDMMSSPTFMPFSLERLVSLGRHRAISVWCVTRRPYLVHPLIRSQAVEIVSFRQTEPRDVAWCREAMGDEAEELPRLAEFQAHVWRDASLSESTG